jgi:hypothetical protein
MLMLIWWHKKRLGLKGLGLISCQGRLVFWGRNRQGIFSGRKGGKNNQKPKGGKNHD